MSLVNREMFAHCAGPVDLHHLVEELAAAGPQAVAIAIVSIDHCAKVLAAAAAAWSVRRGAWGGRHWRSQRRTMRVGQLEEHRRQLGRRRRLAVDPLGSAGRTWWRARCRRAGQVEELTAFAAKAQAPEVGARCHGCDTVSANSWHGPMAPW